MTSFYRWLPALKFFFEYMTSLKIVPWCICDSAQWWMRENWQVGDEVNLIDYANGHQNWKLVLALVVMQNYLRNVIIIKVHSCITYPIRPKIHSRLFLTNYYNIYRHSRHVLSQKRSHTVFDKGFQNCSVAIRERSELFQMSELVIFFSSNFGPFRKEILADYFT